MMSLIVRYILQVSINSNETVDGSECVFWNFTLNDGYGDWSTEGCIKVSDNSNRAVCRCNHLASFAVLLGSIHIAPCPEDEFDGTSRRLTFPPTRLGNTVNSSNVCPPLTSRGNDLLK